MLLDLGRNDIGRLSKPGTVKVTEMLEVERYSHVMHLVSHVTGQLREDKSVFDALRSCFPAGTVSGAPKIRAMQIIAELEGQRRGVYGGRGGVLQLFRQYGYGDRHPYDGREGRHGLPSGGRRESSTTRIQSRSGLESLQKMNALLAGHRPCGSSRVADKQKDGVHEMLLLIDNYDSFTYNLYQFLSELGAEVEVVRNDAVTLDDVEGMSPERIVISPGPCTPSEAGISTSVVHASAARFRSLASAWVISASARPMARKYPARGRSSMAR